MIIADQQPRIRKLGKYLKPLIIGGTILGVLFYFSYPLFQLWKTQTQADILFFDAETVWRKSYISNGQFFTRGQHQSNEEAHSGKYSSKVTPGEGMRYGVSGNFLELVPGATYEASVWLKAVDNFVAAGLVVQGNTAQQFYLSTEEIAETGKFGWKKLWLKFKLPNNYSESQLQIYVYTNGRSTVYFDDMLLQKQEEEALPEADEDTVEPDFEPPILDLQVKPKAMKVLQNKRDSAFRQGILVTDETSWVKAQLSDKGKIVPVKIRLKGDWTDHLKEQKWSFRVKVKDPEAWNRLIVFSLQTPAARYHAEEWVLHQFWEREDVLTTRYDFARLSLNGKSLGIYAYEEHFDKQLLEYKSRREGPILRFVEDAMWEIRLRNSKEGYVNNHPAIAQAEVADIQPFKEGRTSSSPKLREDFEMARHLLYQYQTGEKSAAEIFDLERMGKFLAICDVMGSFHGLIWHNQRFYYNPVISKLEPIGYDGYSGPPYPNPHLLGHGHVESSRPEYVSTLKRLVEDRDFLKEYFKYLQIYSSEDYLDHFFEEIDKGLKERTAFIQEEFANYYYNKKRLYKRAKLIRSEQKPLSQHSVRAYWKEKKESGAAELELRNFHEMPLALVGTSPILERMLYPLEEPALLSAYYFGYPVKKQMVEAPADARYIFYKDFGSEKIYTADISAWSATLKAIPAQEYAAKKTLTSNEIYQVEGGMVRFNTGQHQITEDIIIPAGHRVVINAGTYLDFQKGAKFLSYSPVNILGIREEPVRIFSSDHSAAGFTVLQVKELSELSYVTFDHFNTLKDRSWQLTGAVTFYESDVNLRHCIFQNNHCEDGLNLIRSTFKMENIVVRNAPFDGFDADFCEGTIYRSDFIKTGNDGVDVSGSKITIEGCSFKDIGDKGISVGEDSNMRIAHAQIDGATIGVASKDLSFLRINAIALKNCNQGFAAFQKKPEYGPSIIQVDSYKEENVNYLYTIAPGCRLKLKNRLIIGER